MTSAVLAPDQLVIPEQEADALPRSVRLLLTGKMGAGKSFASDYLHERYGAVRWSRTELMKPLAHALADGAGELDVLLARVFPEETERSDVRRELFDYIGSYVPEKGKSRRLYQDVVEICQQHDPYCFETELEKRIHDAGQSDFLIIDDVRVRDAFDYFAARGYATLRIEADEEVRKKRMLARDGFLPAQETLNHRSETELDGVPHDFIVLNNYSDLPPFHAKIDRVVALLRNGQYERGVNRAL